MRQILAWVSQKQAVSRSGGVRESVKLPQIQRIRIKIAQGEVNKTSANAKRVQAIAKRLIDYGFHPYTVSFPLIVHGALMIGPRHRISDRNAQQWLTALKAFEIKLYKDGPFVDCGTAMSVLDGPLSALAHLVRLLDRDPDNPQLQAGEIVTTGTVTRAFPVAGGQTWTTEINGIALDPLSVTFT